MESGYRTAEERKNEDKKPRLQTERKKAKLKRIIRRKTFTNIL